MPPIKRPPHELAIPHEVAEEVTGVLSGEALTNERKKRPTEEAIAHHDVRIDDHDERLAAVELGQVRVEGKVDAVHATQSAHTAILGSQSAQLERLLNERSAEFIASQTTTVVKKTATVERTTATYKTLLTWLTPLGAAVVGWLLAHAGGC